MSVTKGSKATLQYTASKKLLSGAPTIGYLGIMAGIVACTLPLIWFGLGMLFAS
jgi:tetrahydromethanopterin S-methyltransferase subunit C